MALLVQLAGSTLVLIAFVAGQAGRLAATSRRYLALNLVGSLGLAVSAVVEAQWGFLVLEAAWCAVSFDGLRRALTTR
jgi:hypothetical protein